MEGSPVLAPLNQKFVANLRGRAASRELKAWGRERASLECFRLWEGAQEGWGWFGSSPSHPAEKALLPKEGGWREEEGLLKA